MTLRANQPMGRQAGDTLLLDSTRGPAGPSLDDSIHEVAKRDKTADKAILGYARFDLIKYYDHLVFGEWNNRPLVDSQVQSLYQSFLANGVDHFNPIHAIPLVVPKKWLVEGSYSQDVDKHQELPILEISGSAPKVWKIKAAGGHHRTKAIEAWMKKINKEYEMQLAEERNVARSPADNIRQLQIEHINKAVRICLQKLAGMLEYGGQWMVTVFDESQIDEIIGLHISQNETKHIYMQLPEEGLIQQYKILSATGKNWSNVEHTMAGGIFAKQNELLTQDYIFSHLEMTVSSSTHYIYLPEMQFNQFYNMMFSSYGGIVADITMRLENRLRRCFNMISYDSRMGDAEMYQQLKQAHPVLAALSDPLREALNSVYEKHLGGQTAASYRLGNTNKDIWSKAYLRYKLDVIDVMEDYVRDKKKTQAINDLSDDVQTVLEGCATKASLVLHQHDNLHNFIHFPLMSRSVITTLVWNLIYHSHLKILQVSAWFSPLLYMAKAHGKDWTPGSASADMIRAIMCHPDYDPEQCMYAVTEIISSIFEMFPEFLHMEGQLVNINISCRVTKQQELQMVFGIADHGKESKCSMQKGKKKGKKNDDDDDDDDDGNDVKMGLKWATSRG
ncbi:hypothetical protein DFJ58DRAFT_734071 [Suillus subalutaceus]|uniref:uncharacterized protein n=1 Tax=Suillus subalutaceus TaxID=48586 RepID=UPI001B8724DE|nr:uncharacterized protein DFJ58DRAFT_734071 [Suillus subalutaceus]KAG1837976.1 hypothetical protein DFJ58DRAFT_734071 [Suillus subalutaceus]